MDDRTVSERANTLHRAALVWDGHAGFAFSPDMELDELHRWRESGVDHLSLNVAGDPKHDTVLEAVSSFRRWVHDHAEGFALVEVAADVRRAKRDGKLALSFDIEGTRALNEELENVRAFHGLGVRQMLIAYNRSNAAGGGCHGGDTGLTAFGRSVVEEMNRVGMIVDCSHCAFRTTLDVMEASSAPVVFSHSNARALCDHERNVVDEQIERCAATGGVVGVVGLEFFLGPGEPSAEAMAEHVHYMADRVGMRHVAIGLDYTWQAPDDLAEFVADTHWWPSKLYPRFPRFVEPEALPALTDALLSRGHSEDDVRGVLGENYLRVAEQVWKPSEPSAGASR